MKENIKDIEGTKIKGHAKIEIFDAGTGRLQKCIEKDNFIAAGANGYWAKMQRDSLTHNLSADVNRSNTQYDDGFNNDNFFNRLILSSDATPEDPANTNYIHDTSKITGQLDIRGITTSANTMAGALNLSESYVGRDSVHIVGDFGTDRGNGTFQSIGFVNTANGVNDYSPLSQQAFAEGFISTGNVKYRTWGSYIGATRVGNQFYVVYHPERRTVEVTVFDLDNQEAGLQHLNTFGIEFNPVFFYGDLTFDGTNLYMVCDRYNIYKLDLNGTLVETIETSIPYIRGIFYNPEEQVFYVTSGLSTGTNELGLKHSECVYKLTKTGVIDEILPAEISGGRPIAGLLKGQLLTGTNQSETAFLANYSELGLEDLTNDTSVLFHIKGSSNNYDTAYTIHEGIIYEVKSDGINIQIGKVHLESIFSRLLLPSAQTKTNAQTMKITYDINFTDWANMTY